MVAVVVGGGVTGLAAAHALARAGIPAELVEASERLGGKIATVAEGEYLVEAGPDSFITVRPVILELCRELGLEGSLVGTKDPRNVYVWHGGRLVPMPEGLDLVLPTRFLPFARSPLFGPLEKLRAGLDLVLPRRRDEADEAVGALVRRRLGNALADRLAGPLVGGIYGTPLDELSLLAVLPRLREAERDHRSLLLASLAAGRGRRARAGTSANGGTSGRLTLFVSLAGGMIQLVDALAASLDRSPVRVRTGAAVAAIAPDGPRHRVRLTGGEEIVAEQVVLACPAPVAAGLVEPFAPEAAGALRAIPYGSTTSISFGFRRERIDGLPSGHGFVVPRAEGLAIAACTWASQKWPRRAPEGSVLVRAFLDPDGDGGATSDEEIVGRALADVRRTIGVRGEPELARLDRWDGAMPRYTVGHLDRVAAAEAALAGRPGLILAGAAYRGVGIPDCVTQGRSAAQRVVSAAAGGSVAAA